MLSNAYFSQGTTLMAPANTPQKPVPPSYAILLSGGLSGLTSCILLQPLDLLKTRLQQPQSNHVALGNKTNRLVHTVQQVLKDSGPIGLWRGTWPTILRNVPGVALYFYSVTELRSLLALRLITHFSLPASGESSTIAQATAAGNLLVGATARVAVGFILCPITVVKARIEVGIGKGADSLQSIARSCQHSSMARGSLMHNVSL